MCILAEDNSTATRAPPKPKTLFSRALALVGDSVRSIVATLNYLQHKWRTNTLIQSQKNIREHYDLGNDMFELFLDDSMTYSCAIFEGVFSRHYCTIFLHFYFFRAITKEHCKI